MRLKFCFIFLFAFCFIFNGVAQTAEKNPVLMTVDGKPITKQQFLRVYLKNNDNPQYDKSTLDKYMKLYKEFRLKVAEAEAEGYDTIPSLVNELNGYKDQLAKPYLLDTTKLNALVKEAYQRMKQEVKAAHILIRLAPDAGPKDTLEAYNEIMKIRQRIIDGSDFGEVAQEVSQDVSAKKNKGELGYFSAFQMVYPFETAAYTTPIGEVSMPVRSSYGYHIVKVEDKRPARGTIYTAHIMVAVPKKSGRDTWENAKQKIDEIYQKLQDGASFEKMAKLYSDDSGSKNKGGELPPFGTGTNRRMIPIFEEQAFALQKDGDYSKPFQSSYGFHIVKRLSLKPIPTFAELEPKIKEKVEKDKRGKLSKKAFIDDLIAKHGIKDKSEKRLNWFYANIDSSIFNKTWQPPKLKKDKWIFAYRGNKYGTKSFLNYMAKNRLGKKVNIKELINNNYLDWRNQLILKDEKNKLGEEYPDYKALMQEYHDGILLYEIMKDKVWNKALLDTNGLKTYFENHINKYQWPARVKASIYSSVNKDKVLEAKKLLAAVDTLTMNEVLSKVNADSQLNLAGEEGKFDPTKKTVLKGRDLTANTQYVFKKDDKYYFVVVDKKLPTGPKKLDETRGLVIQDYQNYLENNWLKKLKEKHTIKVNKDVLYSLGD